MAEFLNASVAPENFDWDAFEGNSSFSGEEKQKIQEAYDQTLSKVVENEVVEGEVTAINKREVIVTIGGKSEGVISAPEFRYNPELAVGDKVVICGPLTVYNGLVETQGKGVGYVYSVNGKTE